MLKGGCYDKEGWSCVNARRWIAFGRSVKKQDGGGSFAFQIDVLNGRREDQNVSLVACSMIRVILCINTMQSA